MKTYDLLIIGAGPAGLAAGIQAAHMGMDHAVIDKKESHSRLKLARKVENFPLVKKSGIPGKELYRTLLNQARGKGVVFKERTALSIAQTENIFQVQTEKGLLGSKAIIIATGLAPKKLNKIIALPYLEKKKLFYRWTDIPLAKVRRRVLVIGGGEVAFDQACSLAEKGFEVAVAVRGTSDRVFASLRREARALGISLEYNIIVRKITEDDNGIAVTLENVVKIIERKYDQCLVAIGSRRSALKISSEARSRLNRGLYYAGDMADPHYRQTAIAFADGMKKTIKAYKYIQEEE